MTGHAPVTAGRSDHESANLDAYIVGQLARASAELARHTDTEEVLQAVLHATVNTKTAGQDQEL